MAVVSGIVFLMEILSLVFLGLCVSEFRLIARRHAAFFRAMGEKAYAKEERMSSILLWVYIITTVAIALITIFFFVFQPHLL